MTKRKKVRSRKRIKSLEIVPLHVFRNQHVYGIYWKGRVMPDCRLTVAEVDGILRLHVHTDGLGEPGKNSLQVLPCVSNEIIVEMS